MVHGTKLTWPRPISTTLRGDSPPQATKTRPCFIDLEAVLFYKRSLLFLKARVTHPVICTHANRVPLNAETNKKYFKEIFVDVGLCSGQLGLTLDEVQAIVEINLINKGGIAEQSVGQILRTIFPFYVDPSLYCWIRTTSTSNAEVDYIIQHNSRVIPIEVKAGKAGTLKSLHYFMSLKGFDLAIRVNSDYPSITKINLKNTQGNPVQFKLLSIPFYLLGQLHRLIDALS